MNPPNLPGGALNENDQETMGRGTVAPASIARQVGNSPHRRPTSMTPVAVAGLPRNAMGKVQKNILRDTYSKIYSK